MTSGVVRRVNGPVVEVELSGLAMADLIEVGRHDLPAEVVALRGGARAAAAALRLSPDYARLRQSLLAHARALLGPEAVIVDTDDGGIVGSVPGRRVDLSLATFADRAVDAVLSARLSHVDGER